jgi:endoglucanase
MGSTLHRLRCVAALGSLIALAACGGSSSEPDDAAVAAPAPATVDSTAPSSDASSPEATPAAVTGVKWRGVNLSGAEFTSTALPGKYGYQYVYPSVSSVDYFKAKGMNLVRLPFLWERLQPTLNGALDTTELTRLKDFVAGTTAKGVTVLIDPHNYARYRGQVIGSNGVPARID